jgi:hypothetical protein
VTHKQRVIALALIWTLPSVITVAATALVYHAYRIPPPDRLGDDDRTAVMRTLRAALVGAPDLPCAVHAPVDAGSPVAVSVWSNGSSIARVDGTGADVGTAVDEAAKALRTMPAIAKLSPADRERARIQVDVTSGHKPLGNGFFLFDAAAFPGFGDMMAIDPGIEGIGADVGDHPMLLPHELVGAKVLSTKRPAQALPEFAIGVDLGRVAAMLASRNHGVAVEAGSMFRFRTDAFVEWPVDRRAEGAPPIQLVRGNAPRPKLTAKVLRDAALAGGRYLVAHMGPNGRYVYEHDLLTGAQTDPMKGGAYSMPRHAGTTYFLAQLYRITKEPWLREPIERAFAHLAELMAAGHCATTLPDGTAIDCVLDKGESTAHLGSTALAVVALAEYQRATGDARYLPIATKLTSFILFMQRPDGSFRHLYDPRAKKADDETQLLYYSGEASLALARMYVVTHDPKYAKAAEAGIDWLVHWYDFFLGGFMFGEEHWTCISAEAIWPAVKSDDYNDFCRDYGSFLRAQQPAVGDYPDEDDLAGGYSVSAFLLPYNTPTGSRTETMISAYELSKDHGAPDEAIRGQVEAALGYLVSQQVRPDSDFSSLGPADGGMPANPIERTVRIDFVQHTCSAMLRASEWIDDP